MMVIVGFAIKDFKTPPADNELIRNFVRQHSSLMTASQNIGEAFL